MEGINRTFREKSDEFLEVTWYIDTEIGRLFRVALLKNHFVSLYVSCNVCLGILMHH